MIKIYTQNVAYRQDIHAHVRLFKTLIALKIIWWSLCVCIDIVHVRNGQMIEICVCCCCDTYFTLMKDHGLKGKANFCSHLRGSFLALAASVKINKQLDLLLFTTNTVQIFVYEKSSYYHLNYIWTTNNLPNNSFISLLALPWSARWTWEPEWWCNIKSNSHFCRL